MRLLFICLFFLLFYFGSFSQRLSYQFPEKFSDIYNFKPDQAYSLLQEEAKKSKEPIDVGRVQKMYSIQYNFDANRVYMNWDEPEVYLLKLMDSLIPDSFEYKKYLNLYILRDPTYNAYATSTGIFNINIGLLAKVRNEAVLSHVIAHECGHYLMSHHQKSINASKNSKIVAMNGAWRSDYLMKSQKFELEADYFSALCLAKMGYDLKYVAQQFDYLDMKDRVYSNSRGYESMVKASEQGDEYILKRKAKSSGFRTHPLDAERMLMVNKIKESNNGKSKFVLDSLMFTRLRKAAREECKKIYFENSEFNSCLEIAFIDYLYEPKNIKNIYYIFESLRRFSYVNPKKMKEPFLMDAIEDDKMFYAKQSILYKPDYLFTDVEEYEELKSHPFFVDAKKPFNTYEEAYLYFTDIAKKMSFNEANLSLALHYYGKKNQDSVTEYLNRYINGNNGLYIDFAKDLLKSKQPNVEAGKSLYLVDNVGCYSGYSFSYFLAKKRTELNPEIATALNSKEHNADLIIMNEYLGSKPKELFEYQKLLRNVTSLFTEEDIFNFKKRRLSSKETQDEFSLSHKFNKHIFILAPEYYNWFKERGYSKLMLIECVHQFEYGLNPKEIYNTYTGYYLDINAIRPYFKDATRNGFNRMQKNNEIYQEVADFLYNKE